MSLSRWKVLACTLTIGVGGLAVFATPPSGDKKDSPKEPEPLPNLSVKPATPPTGADTPAPVKPVKDEDLDLDIPALPTVTKTEAPDKKPEPPVILPPTTKPAEADKKPDIPNITLPPATKPAKADKTPDIQIVLPPPVKPDPPAKLPDSEPVFEPISPPPAPAILPVKGEADPKPIEKAPSAAGAEKEPAKPAGTPTTESPKPATGPVPLLDLDTPPPPPASKPSPPAPPVAKDSSVAPPVSPPTAPPTKNDVLIPPVSSADPPKATTTPTPVPPKANAVPPLGVPTPPLKNAESAKLKLLLRVGDGQPRFEIRNSQSSELLLKVYGEKVEMQTPPESRSSLAGVTAMGRVRFTARGIEGTCDHLTILSATGEVLMKGNIRLKTRHGKSWSEMTAEKMVYQVGTSGLASSGSSTPHVRPASYIPD